LATSEDHSTTLAGGLNFQDGLYHYCSTAALKRTVFERGARDRQTDGQTDEPQLLRLILPTLLARGIKVGEPNKTQ